MSKSRRIVVAASIACLWLPTFSVSAQDITERDISFNNEGYTFAGTLLYAANREADEKSPAVIMVHGSGDGPGHQFRPMAETYARNGFVVLIYDKRDNWASVPLTTLAADVQAGLQLLAAQAMTDASRIGVFGVSQAGWVLPIVTADSETVKFGIVITGGGATPRESEIYSWQQILSHNGLGKVEQEAAAALLELYYDYMASGEDAVHQALQSALESNADESWFPILALDKKIPDANDITNWGWVGSFDPVPFIAQSSSPYLALLGANDMDAPPQASVDGWRDGFIASGISSSRVQLIEGAGHGLVVGDHDASMHGETRQFVDDYYGMQFAWLRSIGMLSDPDMPITQLQ